mmetsp:Transcript_18692/g.43380  ORF Transcript_18692/g.43380 Transcript_18692/m.43380 type:complete len:151 (+) Transcript_18692:379-831(+)
MKRSWPGRWKRGLFSDWWTLESPWVVPACLVMDSMHPNVHWYDDLNLPWRMMQMQTRMVGLVSLSPSFKKSCFQVVPFRILRFGLGTYFLQASHRYENNDCGGFDRINSNGKVSFVPHNKSQNKMLMYGVVHKPANYQWTRSKESPLVLQ